MQFIDFCTGSIANILPWNAITTETARAFHTPLHHQGHTFPGEIDSFVFFGFAHFADNAIL